MTHEEQEDAKEADANTGAEAKKPHADASNQAGGNIEHRHYGKAWDAASNLLRTGQ